MQFANLNKTAVTVDTSKDCIIIIQALSHVPGGTTLDVSGVGSSVTTLSAGHVILQNDTTGDYLPLGVTDGAYDSISAGYHAVGVLKTTILVSDPRASIVTRGQVNAAASPYPVTETIKTALPHIEFFYA